MRRLFTLLIGLALALPTFAQSIKEQLEGDWTFTVMDNTNNQVKNIQLTYTDDYGEGYFYLANSNGLIYVGGYGTNADGTIYLRFDNSVDNQKIGSYYYTETAFYVKDGDKVDGQVYADYNPTTEKFVKFYRKSGSLTLSVDNIGFSETWTDTRGGDPVGSFDFTIIEGGKSNGDQPLLSVSLPEGSYAASYTSATEAQITATPSIVAENVESYDVYYSLYFDSTPIVNDTKIEPVNGEYKIQVGDLEFERSYTLKVWAVAGDYTSSVAEQMIFTGYAPDIRLSVTADNVGINTADLVASINYYDVVEPVSFTLSAASTDGPSSESVTTTDRTATLNLTGLKGGTEYVYDVTLKLTDGNGVVLTKVASNVYFKTEPSPEPVVTITFPEGSVTSSIQSRYYAQIIATPTIEVENADDYNVFYALYMGATKVRNDVEVAPNAEGEYVITVEELPFSRTYRLEVYVTVGDDFTSEPASVEIETVAEPGITIVSAVAENVTENSAEIVVEIEPISLGDNLTYYVGATSTSGPEVEEFATTDTSFTLKIDGLTPGEIYTYNLRVTTTVNGSMYQANKPVVITTLEASQAITLSDISYTQIPDGGAYFKVGKVDVLGFDASEVDVYFQLVGSDAAPEKAVLVTNGDESYYEYTFSGLKPYSPYQTIIFGGVGTYGSDDFFKGQEYKENFVTGQTGVGSIATDYDPNSRYFNLQGIEVKNPAPGGLYIRVNGSEVTKVIVK